MDIYYNPPESQLREKMDYKMDMGIFPREMDKQLCLETGIRTRAYTSYPDGWKLNILKIAQLIRTTS